MQGVTYIVANTELQFSLLNKIVRIWGGSYHDYWFTDDAILKVRLVPISITILGIVILVALTAVLGIFGVVIGAAVAFVIYLTSGRIAKRRRHRVLDLSPDDLKRRGLVTLRVPYSLVSEAEIKGNRLTISVEGRKIRIKIPEDDMSKLQALLRVKIGTSFFVSD
jgi:hypothetical protein